MEIESNYNRATRLYNPLFPSRFHFCYFSGINGWFLIACYATLHPAMSVYRSVGPLFWYFWALWAYCSCPNALVTFSSTAPAHPHATGIAVYPALLSYKHRWERKVIVHLQSYKARRMHAAWWNTWFATHSHANCTSRTVIISHTSFLEVGTYDEGKENDS